MKVSIFHEQADAIRAAEIAGYLRVHYAINSYLDAIDPKIEILEGPELAAQVQKQMDGCDSLLALISNETEKSQWIPWEIGIATGKNLALATFADTPYPLPESLQRWPHLKSFAELDKCLDSWGHVPARNWPLFKARNTLRELYIDDNPQPIS